MYCIQLYTLFSRKVNVFMHLDIDLILGQNHIDLPILGCVFVEYAMAILHLCNINNYISLCLSVSLSALENVDTTWHSMAVRKLSLKKYVLGYVVKG